MGPHENKSFCNAKETIINILREPTTWENVLANGTSDTGLISKIYRGLIQFNKREKKSN